MKDDLLQQLSAASKCIADEKVIAYPTETVFGLGCDPLSEIAVTKLLKIKNRSWQKGLIVIAANTDQLKQFLSPEWLKWLTKKQPVKATSYIIPCLDSVPQWLKGTHQSLLVRITSAEISQKLCQLAGPLVSTSANKAGMKPLLDSESVATIFKHELAFIVAGKLNPKNQSSQIIDALTNEVVRS